MCVFIFYQDSETEAAYQTFSQTEGESSAAEVFLEFESCS